ncbi:MAG: hypothetical protein AAGA48_40235 [Myxococcota bacterium]
MSLRFVVEVLIPSGIALLIVVAAAIGKPEVAPAPVPVAPTVGVVVPLESSPAAVEARTQPRAYLANELVAPWSSIRGTVARQAMSDPDQALAEELRNVVETLRRTRRSPAQSLPWAETVAELDRLAEALQSTPKWSRDDSISAALMHHRSIMERLARR